MAFRRSHRSGGIRRATNWLSSAIETGENTLAAATATIDQSFSAAQIQAQAPAGGTIVRTRGTLWVKSDQAVATESPIGALGFMVVREQARVVGVTAVPTPTTESFDDGFFVHQFWQAGMSFVQVDATGTIITGNLWKRYDFDSKAQRKFIPDDAFVITMENSHASDGVLYQIGYRLLIKPGVSR